MRDNRVISTLAFALIGAFIGAGCPEPQYCTLGEEACACYEDSCFGGLECRSGVCVDISGDEDGAGDEVTGEPPPPPPQPTGAGSGPTFPESETGDPTTTGDPMPEPNETDESGDPEDNDRDGWNADLDCDDNDPRTFPLREGVGSTWEYTLISGSATICPGNYRHAAIEVIGDELYLSGQDVTLDGDGFDYIEEGYVFPMIYVHDSTEVDVVGFRFTDFRGTMTAIYVGDSGHVTIESVQVDNFVQAAYGPDFGTIHASLVANIFIGNSIVDGAMGRIAVLGGGSSMIFQSVVNQSAASYPEPAPFPMPAAIHISGVDSANGYVPAGEASVWNNQVSVVDGTSAIYLRGGNGGSVTDNSVQCGFTTPQYGISSDSDHNKYIAENSVDACWDGISGFGNSAGNQIDVNVISNYLNYCVNFDTQTNIIGDNECL